MGWAVESQPCQGRQIPVQWPETPLKGARQMHPFSLKCFGVGDGAPCDDRNHSSYLYHFGPTTLLLDCGEPLSRSFKATGLSYDSIERIFISHLHSDHIGGFFMMMQGFWLEQRKKDLCVHLPAEGIEPIRSLLQAAYLFDELLHFRLSFEPLEAGRPVEVEHVRVTPFPTTHLARLRQAFQKNHPQAFAAFSFLLESDGLRVAHSADLGAPEDLAPLLSQPLDLLVCELAHFKREDMFQYLKGRQIQRIVFTHVDRRYWERLEETRQLAAQMLPGVNITFARDQEIIALG
jgi:ribonuclease BN (tRNA processing enzyme)